MEKKRIGFRFSSKISYAINFFISVFLISSLEAYGGSKSKEKKQEEPWLTGTLLVSPGSTTPKGKILVQPYFYAIVNNGFYDKNWNPESFPNFYTFNTQLFLVAGLTDWMDFQMLPQVLYNNTQGENSVNWGDLEIGFDFQLIKTTTFKYLPGMLLSTRILLPAGIFDDLDPTKLGTDATGGGALAGVIDFVFYKLYHICDLHFLSTTFEIDFVHFASASIRGFNIFEGGKGTEGVVSPGDYLNFLFSFEYSFNQNWVFALDNQYTHFNSGSFSGNPGSDPTSRIVSNKGLSSREILSFAPALEYNFNKNFGIIGGAYFSASGRNTPRFRSFVLSAVVVF